MRAQKRKRKRGQAYLLQFTLFKRRRAMYLPTHYSDAQASRIAAAIQECAAAIESERNVDKATWAFLNSMSDDLRARFIRAGLLERDKTIEELWRAFVAANESNWAEKTKIFKRWCEQTMRKQIDFSRDDVTTEEWQTAFDAIPNNASRSGCVQTFKALFNWAVDAKIVDESPIKKVKGGGYKNKSREHFVTREEYKRFIARADVEARALFACYRFGGLRLSEALLLEWEDIGKDSVRVRSPKTAKQGKGERTVPLFPEWRAALDALSRGRGLIFPRWNYAKVNNTTQKLFRLSGLRWERMIQNLRASRASEIQSEFGEVCESAWLGHTPTIARDHYLQPTANDFKKAVAKKVANDEKQ